MGGFMGIGHSSEKTDRGNQLAGINAEWNVYNRGLPFSDADRAEGKDTREAGIQTLDDVKRYWQSIMAGGRPAVMRTAAPAINAVNEQADAARNEQAQMGTSRGGGETGFAQQQEMKKTADINNIVGNIAATAPTTAAKELTGVAKTESDIGTQQVREALLELGLTKEVADEIINSSMQSRVISHANSPARGFEYALGYTLMQALGGGGG